MLDNNYATSNDKKINDETKAKLLTLNDEPAVDVICAAVMMTRTPSSFSIIT